ncbi:sigma 54-interacting transcriptional regulator [Maioricimonas sp. JC845]|uniref:sigma-54 interaction domain-containing protein n=1 Tax=Maioricimonas sp. JC845 TaxID=3232138 RepID=UPI00345AD891
MPQRRILVQWIGHSDLRAMAASLSPARRKKLLASIGGNVPDTPGDGPTKTLLKAETFDEVRLLSNYDRQFNRWFQEWLDVPVTVSEVELATPTDYAAIFSIADRELSDLCRGKQSANRQLCLHLSPGTPAMAAVWLLLGKTRYPATFYETSRDGRHWVTNVPFELVDVIPDILRNPDEHLQHLAADAPSDVEGFEDIAGDSRAIRDAVGRARRAAIRNVSVLLLGESGTGKEMFAQAIHKASARRKRPFVAINCAALSKSLLESELFGHARGAFTGAQQERKGAFETADGGTLFLDEVGECDLETQAKLLRVLQPVTGKGIAIRRICRLGEEREREVNVRVVAATNRDLHAAITDGTFREDLYYRLATLTITLPPLRHRRSDIPKIANHLLDQINRQFAAEEPGYRNKTISPSAMTFVKQHNWPGNVRQLYNALVQTAVLTDGDKIGQRELAAALGEMPAGGAATAAGLDHPLGDGFNLEEHLKSIQKHYLQRAMQETRGVKAQAARLLGIENYQTLAAQLQRLGVSGNWTSND